MGPKKIELDLKAGPITCNYGEFDTNANLDSNNKINCNGNTCNITGNGVTATQGLITISAAGDYILEGDFQGQVLIQAQKKDDVHLILNNSSISSNNGPAINALEADKVVLTLSGNNKIVDSLNYTGNEKDPDACIFSKTDLTINGDGNLEVTGVYADAIRSTKDIKLVSGNINVNAKGKGIKGKNSICIKDATININSTDSALKVTSQENKNKGYLVIDNGKLTISTENDALHAETHFTNHNGNIDIKACKEGIEAQMVDILGGEIHIKATDDGINAAQVGKAGEEMPPPPPPGDVFDPSQPPPPKPFDPHANDGSIYVNIVGGKVYVDVTEEDCDGIDTNGIAYIGGDAQVFISVNGGEIYGPISTIDAEGDNSIVAGATFVGTAGDFDWNLMMPPNMRNNNKEKNNKEKKVKRGEQTDKAKVYQPKVLMEIPMQKAGTELTLKDKSNNTIVSFTPGNDYSHVLITSPKIVAGETYNLISGNGNNTQSIVAAKADEGSPKPPSVTSSSGSLSSISLSMATLVIAMIVALLQF
ncbi:hypothetical protein BCR36DRAFT_585015 [Piromyces finnis]|uniref:Carbohydrate-binding domain-containing protein n=1 Tax=Piromyces finnis TaxID=1754191 RepID=A0A1Y1V4B1_9FUNG|nr:hypothetical protein BCR36DRAFT_585015 [Piromyces finnis]|eukprot:ORX46911.1 hypothetical protein BCR36DRAFT_585015 [Piromyces finnis]